MPLKIVADRAISHAKVAFSSLGEVVLLRAEEICAEIVRDADLLLVRSTVQVNSALLGESRVRFVATATAGVEHLETTWLASHNIAWAAAPGANAGSVLQWWTAALLTWAERREIDVAGWTVGVVGVGAIGHRVAEVAAALGCRVLLCDPPRARREGSYGFVELKTLLAESDLVTLHVPLERMGPDATHHLLGEKEIAQLRRGAIVINASRGAVVDTYAFAAARRASQVSGLLLDVFENEPDIAPEVVEACDLATPHIAGYSENGKVAGTLAIYRAACAHLQQIPQWVPERSPSSALSIDTRASDDLGTILLVLRRYYNIEEDDRALRELVRTIDRAARFQRYRAHYPVRRELDGLRLELIPPRPRAERVLQQLGARTRPLSG